MGGHWAHTGHRSRAPDTFNEAHASLCLATSRGRYHLFSESNTTPSLPRCSGVDNIARIDLRRRSIFFRSDPVAALLAWVAKCGKLAHRRNVLGALPCGAALLVTTAKAQRSSYPRIPGAEGGPYIKVSLSYQSDNVRAPHSL